MKSKDMNLSPKVKPVFDHILSQGLTFGEMDELIRGLTRWAILALVDKLSDERGDKK